MENDKGIFQMTESGGCSWQSLEPKKKDSLLKTIRIHIKDYILWIRFKFRKKIL